MTGPSDPEGAMRIAASRRAAHLRPLAVALALVALAQLARHGLVEPPDLTAACDASPWQGPACVLRTLTIQLFIEHRLGGLALAAALLATFTRRRAVAWVALAAGSAGLVLYSTGLSAPAVLLAALVLARPAATAAPR